MKKHLNVRLLIGGGIILVLILMGVFAPLISPLDPAADNLLMRLKAPGVGGVLGTDHLGRDVFTRLLYGARVSIGIGFAVLGISAAVGIALGLLAGWLGGVVDAVIGMIIEILMAFPSMLLSLAVAGILGPGLGNTVLAICLVSWIGYARLVRGMVITLKEKEFVKAARVGGCGGFAIVWRHILPNLLRQVIVYAATNIGSILMQVASLSFLGLGAQPPTAEWGSMLNEAAGFRTTAPWMMIPPGIALVLLVCGFNLLGDGLSQMLDGEKER